MDHLPSDPHILYSSINFLLRDEEFDNLDQICYHFNVDREALESYMRRYGYQYSEEQHKFI